MEAVAVERAKTPMERLGLPPHGGQYLPPGLWGSQASVASPSTFLPSSPAMPFWKHSPSPEYGEGDPHGGFNPNATFPHCPPQRGPFAFSADINFAYGSSPTYGSSSALRRGPLVYHPGNGASSPHQFISGINSDARSMIGGMTGDTYMDEIITTGSAAVVSCHGFSQTGGMDS